MEYDLAEGNKLYTHTPVWINLKHYVNLQKPGTKRDVFSYDFIYNKLKKGQT